MKYSGYCTCFWDEESKSVWLWDEVKDKVMEKIPAENKEIADQIMRNYKANVPSNVICDIL